MYVAVFESIFRITKYFTFIVIMIGPDNKKEPRWNSADEECCHNSADYLDRLEVTENFSEIQKAIKNMIVIKIIQKRIYIHA